MILAKPFCTNTSVILLRDNDNIYDYSIHEHNMKELSLINQRVKTMTPNENIDPNQELRKILREDFSTDTEEDYQKKINSQEHLKEPFLIEAMYNEPSNTGSLSDFLNRMEKAKQNNIDYFAGELAIKPDYYKSGTMDVIEFCNYHNLDFCTGNAIKYLVRAGKKDVNKTIEDLEKAKEYIERLIEYKTKTNELR